jgi:hypothetical protein
MRLVRIDDALENAFVLLTSFASIANPFSTDWVWLGASDQAAVGDWRWTDGDLFWVGGAIGLPQLGRYQHWVAGSPTSGGAATDCAILQSSGFWTDWDCTRLQQYVCEDY